MKIIQISATSFDNTKKGDDHNVEVYALGDDGTLWVLNVRDGDRYHWWKIPLPGETSYDKERIANAMEDRNK